MIFKCSEFISGISIGTSRVHLFADAFDTTGTPAAAYFSSISFTKFLSLISKAENTKSHFLEAFSISETSSTCIFLTFSGIGVSICQRPFTASS